MAGWHKLAEHTRCRAVLLLRVELWLLSAGGAICDVAASIPDVH
jgi:hypothetical protein